MLFWIPELINLFYPAVCAACNNGLFQGEKTLCTKCLYNLPKTGFHLVEGNAVEKQFWGKVPITSATALYLFNKGERVQHLIHRLKYHGEKEVGALAGRILGSELITSVRFSSVNAVIPVPLHINKLITRGFNQSECFGEGVAETMSVPFINDFLVRQHANTTQTRKSRFARFENVDKIFILNKKYELKPMHFLLVDDVITTGSTLTSCAEALLEIPGSKVSIATLAYARL